MARQRYPSDEARRHVKPHVKVHLRARDHRKTAAVFADPTKRGVLVGLWMLGIEKYATKTGGELILSRAEVGWLSGRSRFDHAVKALRSVCESVGYSMRNEGGLTLITIRNLAKKNGLPSARRGATARSSAELRPPLNLNADADAESDAEKKRGARAKPSLPLWSLECSELLGELLKTRGPDGGVVRGTRFSPGWERRWAKELVALAREAPEMQENGTDPGAYIKAAIEWALGPENLGQEFEIQIRSASSLRDKWHKVSPAAERRMRKSMGPEAIDKLARELELGI